MRLRLACVALGVVIGAAGVALVFVPAGLIALAVCLVGGGLLWDDGKPKR